MVEFGSTEGNSWAPTQLSPGRAGPGPPGAAGMFCCAPSSVAVSEEEQKADAALSHKQVTFPRFLNRSKEKDDV